MNRTKRLVAAAAVFAFAAFGAGCDDESGIGPANLNPNTRISVGPPERSDTSYLVDIFWFGFDEDGEVSHYELAWETQDNWIGPIFSTDSLFSLEASETCCVDPLPDFGTDLPDSVYEQFHTFFIRAVDDDGDPDLSPAFRSFNSKTIAPYTEVTFGPDNLQFWGTNVEFEWVGQDDDGVVVGYEYVLTNGFEFEYEFGRVPTVPELVAWVDTLTYRPLPGGGSSDEIVWKSTTADSTVFLGVPPISGTIYLFAVRAIDNAGARERILDGGANYRRFNTSLNQDGPRMSVVSNIAGIWTTGGGEGIRDVFAGQGLRFRWFGRPGSSGLGVAGFGFAVDDTSNWSPFSENSIEWPVQVEPNPPEELWFPSIGNHNFYVRSIDFGGFIRVLVAQLRVLPGPRGYPASDRYILAILDSDPASIENNSVFPTNYTIIERSMVEFFLEGYNFQVIETRGIDTPAVFRMDRASSVFWLLSGDVDASDGAIFQSYHSSRRNPNVLPSYVRSGGNLFLCGIQPVNAMRYFDNPVDINPIYQSQMPIDFNRTLTDTLLVPHWAITDLGISRIEETVGRQNGFQVLSRLISQVDSGPNPYPDLEFDPLTTTGFNALAEGFQHFDIGVVPTDAAEVVYTDEATGRSVGVRKLTSPGVNGNTVFLAFHPYFIQKSTFRQLLRAVLTDFGEVALP